MSRSSPPGPALCLHSEHPHRALRTLPPPLRQVEQMAEREKQMKLPAVSLPELRRQFTAEAAQRPGRSPSQVWRLVHCEGELLLDKAQYVRSPSPSPSRSRSRSRSRSGRARGQRSPFRPIPAVPACWCTGHRGVCRRRAPHMLPTHHSVCFGVRTWL